MSKLSYLMRVITGQTSRHSQAKWEPKTNREIEVYPVHHIITPIKKIPEIVIFSR